MERKPTRPELDMPLKDTKFMSESIKLSIDKLIILSNYPKSKATY